MIKLGVLVSDSLQLVETLVLVNNRDESCCGVANLCSVFQDGSELSDFGCTDSLVHSEHPEHIAVHVDLLQVVHVLIHIVKVSIHRAGGE